MGKDLTKEELKNIRLSVGLSQTELARRLGVSYATYSRYERGLCPISGPVKVLAGLLRQLSQGVRR